MSFAECTATSILPASSASSISLTKTPRAPISPNGFDRSLSPTVVIGTSAISTPGPRNREAASSACVSASREPREPTRTNTLRRNFLALLGPLVRAAARELGQLPRLALEPRQLRRDDRDPGQHRHEDDEVCGRDVLLGSAHASSSRSSRRLESSRLPASSTRYIVPARHSSAAHDTQNARNIEPDICGPSVVKT